MATHAMGALRVPQALQAGATSVTTQTHQTLPSGDTTNTRQSCGGFVTKMAPTRGINGFFWGINGTHKGGGGGPPPVLTDREALAIRDLLADLSGRLRPCHANTDPGQPRRSKTRHTLWGRLCSHCPGVIERPLPEVVTATVEDMRADTRR